MVTDSTPLALRDIKMSREQVRDAVARYSHAPIPKPTRLEGNPYQGIPAVVARVVAEECDVPLCSIGNFRSQRPSHVMSRRLMCWILARHLGVKQIKIADWFQRDQSHISTLISTLEAEMNGGRTEETLRAHLERILPQIDARLTEAAK